MKQNEKNATMTPQEAIDRCNMMINSDSTHHAVRVGFHEDGIGYESTFANMKALMLTCKDALEKQVPKTPVNIQGVPVWGYCPECGQIVKQLHDHTGCSNCLQRLTWGESEVA